jgi:hypothetical protein
MRPRTVLLVVIAAIIATFLIANVHALSMPLLLSFVVGKMELTVGAIVVGLLVVVGLACAIYIGLWQSAMLRDYRIQAKELERERQLAIDAEASRLKELTMLIEGLAPRLEQLIGRSAGELRVELRNIENSLSATISELDDRLHRGETEAGSLRLPRS